MKEKCEYCNKEITENYGSGRFCGSKCARGFSTSKNRDEINRKKSETFKRLYSEGKITIPTMPKGKVSPLKGKKREEIFKSEKSQEAYYSYLKDLRLRIANEPWDICSLAEKKRRVFKEQDGKCRKCGISDWMGEPLTLEFEHINGDHYDNRRENVEYLCLNCHSQTPTFRNRKRS